MAEAKKDILVNQGAGASAKTKRQRGAGKTERLHPIIELTLTRLREFVRETEAVFWVFVFPILLAFALGIAFRNTAPEQTQVAIELGARGEGSEATSRIADALSRSPELKAITLSHEETSRALRTGRVSLVVRASGDQAAPAFGYRYDPTRPESRAARLVVDDALQREFGRNDVADVREETTTEPGARYIDFLVPGLIGLNLMGSGMWMLGFAVVQARTRKLLKRLAATPMRRSHYLLSFMLSRLVFLVGEVAAVIVFAQLVFNVHVQGSLLNLAILSLVGAAAFAGLGMLVSARPKTIEGVSGLMNLVMLPMWLLSGTFFSASRFPDSLQPFIKALPLTALNDSLRAVMNEGAPLVASLPEIAVLLAWGAVSFVVALRIFRWQ